ncbi:MAG: 4Fe-4S dicluster domain-containing protein [Verrucomicrobia bacterium]|nr:4Fe-4S dicluster domain-containing protein [Verrucomicrobiota bacterium]
MNAVPEERSPSGDGMPCSGPFRGAGYAGEACSSNEQGATPDSLTRREFMRVMSASLLLGGIGLTGCRRPVEKVVPFSRSPEGYVHGVPQYFATSMPSRETAIPLLVKSYEGRPIKIEANVEHPDKPSNGDSEADRMGTTHHAQAAILSLYDPDRATRFVYKGVAVAREEAMRFLKQTGEKFAGLKGKGLCFLVERSGSPSRARLLRIARERFPEARFFVHEAVDFDIHRKAATLLFGIPVRPVFRLEHARRILSIDCDFLGTEADAHRMIAGFALGRNPSLSQNSMTRLYVVESLLTLTGGNADHRLSLPPSNVVLMTMLLFAELGRQIGWANLGSEAAGLESALKVRIAELPDVLRGWAAACVEDLIEAGTGAVVLAGHRQPVVVHMLAHTMNAVLGSVDHAVKYLGWPEPGESPITELAAELNSDAVETLVILGGNPVYSAPADLDWARTQRKAATVIRLGEYEDETFPVCDLHLPRAHFLESWGDGVTEDGTVVPVQPLIAPLFGGLTELEVLARLCGLATTNPYDIVRDTFRGIVAEGDFEARWHKFLRDGYLEGSGSKSVAEVKPDWRRVVEAVTSINPGSEHSEGRGTYEVVFAPDYRLDDGRYANNGWLQELPDPITKITWDNVIVVGRRTAAQLNLRMPSGTAGDFSVPVVRVEVNGRNVEGPVWVLPGVPENTIGLSLGNGRSGAGRVGNGVGYNAYSVRVSDALFIAAGASISKTDKMHLLACTQWQSSSEGRAMAREAAHEEYIANPKFANASIEGMPRTKGSLYPNPLDRLAEAAPYQWGMAIDLSLCVGCGACIVACQSENNVPIVGKAEVLHRREMHWMRVDRYHEGSLEAARVLWQPMLCQHCEAAPCESVCPVNATSHNDEGLNVMAYNRCVGTRYCSNNCPFKVRRFNYFDYHRRATSRPGSQGRSSSSVARTDFLRWLTRMSPETRPQTELDMLRLLMNPDVTVRMRGVMEKCTFCVQRIEQAKTASKTSAVLSGGATVADGALQTACQQACPAGAIVFGNIKDPRSRVSEAVADPRAYRLLEHLNLRQRVAYLARITNPNPRIRDERRAETNTPVRAFAASDGDP